MRTDYLITVREAADLLGLDEMTVRERLVRGELGGIKQDAGLRRKWYVFRTAVDEELAAKAGICTARVQVDRLQADNEPVLTNAEVCEEEDSPSTRHWYEQERARVSAVIDELLQPLSERLEVELQMKQLARACQEKDAELQAAVFRNGYLEAQLESAQNQLKLLPDLECKARELAEANSRVAALEAEIARRKSTWWYRLGARLGCLE